MSRIEADPTLVTPDRTLYTLTPTETEFWQATRDRLHRRVRYERPAGSGTWERHLLWP
ncbi:pyridoxine 5'-phosphate oxidase C-terminal domain-containing protein [Streptomyces sp. NPDC048182]|uniref:pyridoxine 5'-phosphate oxidase C-terminal domain-containing protein n=1 Tax=unclassified Streptomyces TaxID=2593676 RepID=UPI0033AA01FA